MFFWVFSSTFPLQVFRSKWVSNKQTGVWCQMWCTKDLLFQTNKQKARGEHDPALALGPSCEMQGVPPCSSNPPEGDPVIERFHLFIFNRGLHRCWPATASDFYPGKTYVPTRAPLKPGGPLGGRSNWILRKSNPSGSIQSVLLSQLSKLRRAGGSVSGAPGTVEIEDETGDVLAVLPKVIDAIDGAKAAGEPAYVHCAASVSHPGSPMPAPGFD